MINKRQLLLGAGSVLAASTLPAIAQKNADGVALKTMKHPQPFFEVLYVPVEVSTRFRDLPCAVYRELRSGTGEIERAYLGRFNYLFEKDGTNHIGFKIIVHEEISMAAYHPESATQEQRDRLLKDYKEIGMVVSELPEAMYKNYLRFINQYGPVNAKEIERWEKEYPKLARQWRESVA